MNWRQPLTKWTDDETAMAEAFWKQGYTAAEIAQKLNRSRGSVMGHLNRRGNRRRR